MLKANSAHKSSVLLIDCIDSFTFLLRDLVISCGAECEVISHLAPQIAPPHHISHIIIGPGPGHPLDYDHLLPYIQTNTLPLLGICLGHQLITCAFGGKVSRAKKPMHGKRSLVHNAQENLFKNMPQVTSVGRYHSLIADNKSFPSELQIDAATYEGEIMALSHRKKLIFGLQFHPESFLTESGDKLISSFIELRNT